MPNRWVVLSLDGLATAALSAYGSSWNETPAIDRMAAFGTIWDRAILSSDDSIQVLKNLWDYPVGDQPWLKACQNSGRTELFLNSGVQAIQIAKLAGEIGFDQCTLVEAIPEGASELPESVAVEETALAKLLLPVMERLGDPAKDWSMLWAHSDTLTRCWDAPRSLFPIDDEEEDDDAPVDQLDWSLDDFGSESLPGSEQETASPVATKPPSLFSGSGVPYLSLPADAHPDLITSWMQTYGCQVRLLDRLIDWLLDLIEPAGGEIGLAVLGTSGFSLGQNGWIGHRAGALRSPQIHVPAVLWDGQGHGIRVSGVRGVAAVSVWLRPIADEAQAVRPEPADWANEAAGQQSAIVTDSLRADRVVTTDEWFFVREADRSSLFLKPDDRDDSNDVADRCRDIVEEMESLP